MKGKTAILLAACLSLPAASSADVVLAEEHPRSVAAQVSIRADFLAQVIRLSLPQGQPLADLAAVRRRVVEKLGNSRQVKVLEGQWAWPADAGSQKSAAVVQISVFLPLNSEDLSFLEAAQELAEVMEGLELAHGKVQVELPPVRLAVENAEQHRQRILDAIHLEAEAVESRLGQGGRTTISGLEGPVRVRRSGELGVEVYLDYRLSVEVPAALK